MHSAKSFLTMVVSISGGVLYYGWFLLRPSNRGDALPWLLVIAAETILVLHALASMWTILAGYRDRRDWTYLATRAAFYDSGDEEVLTHPGAQTAWALRIGGRAVSVDVLITVYGHHHRGQDRGGQPSERHPAAGRHHRQRGARCRGPVHLVGA